MGIKTFNVADLGKVGLLDPAKMGYEDSLEIIKDESLKIQKSFVKIGWYLKHIRDEELYKADGYENIYACAAEQLGYAQSTVSRLINICERFSKDHNSPELDEKYSGFDKSQMIEMLPMTPEQIEKVTPDMTVKQIREVNKETKAVKEPSDKDICDFYWKKMGKLSSDKRKNLKEYMIENYGKCHAGGCPNPNFECTLRGIKLNASDEITWTSFVKRVNELIPLQDEVEKEDMDIPGQTSIEKDFPEYMPEEHSVSIDQNDENEKYATSHMDQENIIDGKYREVPEPLSAYGLPKTEYPTDSLLTTKGCGHKYDCFSCAQQCNIRQENRYCVDAPLGNPYRCTTMDILKDMNVFKKDCQFINLEIADHTAGSGEPVPCCKKCKINTTCIFCCDTTKECLDHTADQESDAATETLKKSELDIDGSHRIISTKDILENEDEENLREEIEALADGVREVFWGWEGQPIPKGEVEAAKKNAIKLSFAIEKLLTLL